MRSSKTKYDHIFLCLTLTVSLTTKGAIAAANSAIHSVFHCRDFTTDSEHICLDVFFFFQDEAIKLDTAASNFTFFFKIESKPASSLLFLLSACSVVSDPQSVMVAGRSH
ncbi:hypothetical protein AMECASPLE_038951 [Ameca splendens]|uniref:Secreted protein n=1 Tax=Ameca splendens TaxID=208324 RepID=A0ABV1A6V0_9TELE